MSHVAQYKKEEVENFAKLMMEYPIIGALNMENLPASQLQKLRLKLRGSVLMQMTKKSLLHFAVEKIKDKKKNILGLEKHFVGMPALLFTKENPFKLYRLLKKSKSKAPAKPGQIAPADIVINAGATPFAPGPVISELGAIGLKTGVEAGKVTIKEDKVVVKKGEVINDKAASILLRLGKEPMEIGLDLVAVYEDGVIYAKDVLDVDEAEFMNRLMNAARWAFNLSVEAAYAVKENIEILLQKAFRISKAIAKDRGIMADAVLAELVGKAEMQAKGFASGINFQTFEHEKVKEEVKEEKTDKMEGFKKEEEVAKAVLDKLQKEKMEKMHFKSEGRA